MIFTETTINGVCIIEPELLTDERGFFARSFCKEEFQKQGLETDIVPCNISYNNKKGTIRERHYQVPLFEEARIVSCTDGTMYDVVFRKDSQTYYQWVATNLSYENFKMMYTPKGCTHGFQTLEANLMVYYQMTEFFHSECVRWIRGDDPANGIVGPIPVRIIIEKDQKFPDYEPMAF